MKAIVLAAGRGSRLGGLTDSRCKVMLPVAGKPIIEWVLMELSEAGVKEAIIVHGYAGSRVLSYLGSGRSLGMKLSFVKQKSPHGTLGAAMDALRESVGLRGYGQKDPLIEYKNEGYDMFLEMMTNMRRNVIYSMFMFQPSPPAAAQTTSA